ncbi:RNA 2',3'-cyclic phosphodiesterase [Wenxinia saemankumensis]|uniref:RNA 2',3'-cyclic phosphodiesterase n=1 Tax=Wenxinia saemankumensis TaxID=1447782 RepID=A0A1M6GYL8_9RHOB|nr:RNA 2',3'-cyclic phosphodiesterase [Wenxinia saemankumensis]SHJ15058.1 2'-5' RNA ligase [Wenxinia saemankumensis]
MRCFVSLPVPEPVARALEAVQEGLPFGRPSDPDQFHVTLAFLGELPDRRVEAAHEALETLRPDPFELHLAHVDRFDREDGRMIWAVPADPAPLAALAARVASRLAGAGIRLERRRYRPHVTLARLTEAQSMRDEEIARFLATWHAPPVPAYAPDRFSLVQSIPAGGAHHHEVLADYAIGPGFLPD